MPLENIAWAVDGGIVSPAQARMLAYHATSGEEGVAGIGDFLVRQTTVASGNVRINAGGATLLNRYPGAKNESYMVRAGDETLLAIPQNSGGAMRYDMVIVRVDDWNMPGGQAEPAELPTDEVPTAKFQVITGVSSTAKTAAELGLNYPAIALARIAIPAATAAITTAMITPLRELVQPRRKRDVRSVNLVAADPLDFTGVNGELWPDAGRWTMEVPYWASACNVVATWNAISRAGSATPTEGRLWIRFGEGRGDAFNTSQVKMRGTNPGAERISTGASERRSIPATMRGQSVYVDLKAYKDAAFAGPSFNADEFSSITIDLEWLEAPTEDI